MELDFICVKAIAIFTWSIFWQFLILLVRQRLLWVWFAAVAFFLLLGWHLGSHAFCSKWQWWIVLLTCQHVHVEPHVAWVSDHLLLLWLRFAHFFLEREMPGIFVGFWLFFAVLLFGSLITLLVEWLCKFLLLAFDSFLHLIGWTLRWERQVVDVYWRMRAYSSLRADGMHYQRRASVVGQPRLDFLLCRYWILLSAISFLDGLQVGHELRIIFVLNVI